MRIRINNYYNSSQKHCSSDDNLTKDDFETYKQEHERLEDIIGVSESIWEDRTFQIAAGGLTLTFTVFSFLSTRGVSFDWQLALIWGVFAICLVLNYVSHRLSVSNARKMQLVLATMREDKKPYDEKSIGNLYKKQDCLMKWINGTVLVLLIADIIYTLIYTCLHLL